MKRAVIIGGGLAGIGAAWYFREKGYEFELFEKESRPGGLCRTERQGAFLFDYTGHLLHFRNNEFEKTVFDLIGRKLEKRVRSAWIYYQNIYTRYPFQANLYGLPVDTIVDCVYEYSKRYFSEKKEVARNFEEWINLHFGEGIARHFMIPYNSKIYRRHPSQLSPDCGGRFVPQSDLKLLLRGAMTSDTGNLGYNSTFFYPTEGGIETLVKGFSDHLKINLNEKVVKVKPSSRTVITSQGREVGFDCVISTQPIVELINSIEDEIDRVRDAARRLKHVSVLNVNVGIKGNVCDKHWIYAPENDFLYHRLGFTHNFSDNMSPSGHSSAYLEISYDPQEGIDKDAAVAQCKENLKRMGFIKSEDDILTVNILDLPYAYVIFDHERQQSLDIIKSYLNEIGLYSAGRFGAWDYTSMEDAFVDGWNASEKAVDYCKLHGSVEVK
jgi:protoporphyrinogen oxidase